MLEHSTVLITGGTGSFGMTMARHLLARGCPRIRIFSRDEAKQDEMRNSFASDRLEFHIGDVRDPLSVERTVHGADLIFHAAALKQVPSCEFFPQQAVQTNVTGSANVIEAAGRAGVRSVVCLSTDKAVQPVNAMGMSKALMEKVALAESRSGAWPDTVVSCVRYGNVMYSRGSVIPLFVRQILAGEPLTITEPSMTRFLMPLSHAVDLVEFALMNAERGDLFIRKSPASTIGDLAEAVRQLFSRQVPVQAIGIRHGEKIYETLATSEELRRSEDMGDYFRVRMDGRGLNYSEYFSEGDRHVAEIEDYHSHNTRRLTLDQVVELLRSLPELQPALVHARS